MVVMVMKVIQVVIEGVLSVVVDDEVEERQKVLIHQCF